jgi:hypothetical protein
LHGVPFAGCQCTWLADAGLATHPAGNLAGDAVIPHGLLGLVVEGQDRRGIREGTYNGCRGQQQEQ